MRDRVKTLVFGALFDVIANHPQYGNNTIMVDIGPWNTEFFNLFNASTFVHE